MRKAKQRLVLAKEDYDIIMANLKGGFRKFTFNRREAADMQADLMKARLVSKTDMPEDVVRLNSSVTIRDEKEGKIMKLTVVSPGQADIKQKKISVMSPIGTALIGYQKGWRVSWRASTGKKIFTILEVNNPFP
ncbi:MAG TPA: GreA/GreB family elongation factor [Flavisolibacter sp.]|nr:GreA/GreB family elongation factor [Flavisolibacter sp.]